MIRQLTGTANIGAAVLGFSLMVPSPTASDGRSLATSGDIAFASRRDGNWEIYLMAPTGGSQRRLTRRDAEDRFPLWSP